MLNMINQSTKVRVRYSETDRMGFVYYGNYAQYLEVGRVETLRSIGLSYKDLEDQGYLLPVKSYSINYMRAGKYDDELIVNTFIKAMPTNRIVFDYEVKRGEELLATASTTLFFMNEEGKACKPPDFFVNQLKPFFQLRKMFFLF